MWLQGDDNGGTYFHAGMFAAISVKLAFSNLGHITSVPSTRCVHEMLPADTATWACMSHYGPRYAFAGLSFPLRLPA